MGVRRLQWWTLPEVAAAKDFFAWLHGATPGAAVVYHRGHLFRWAAPKTSAARAVRSTINVQEQMGDVKIHPLQVRIDQDDYIYIAVRA